MAYRGFLAPGRRWELQPLPLGVSDWQASKALSLAIGGSGAEPQPPTLLGAFGCEWNSFLNSINTVPFSTRRVRLTKAHSFANRGSGAEHLGAFGCKWNPFWNSVNTVLNSAYQTGKHRKRSPSLLGVWRSPSRQSFWEHMGVNGTYPYLWIALTPF